VPDLPLVAALRAEPELRGAPLAIAASAGPRGEIVAVSPEAARAGVRSGASAVRARALSPALHVRVASPALERGVRAALVDVAASLSPRLEPAPPAGGAFAAEAAVFLDAAGVGALFRSEEGFAGALVARARGVGLPAVAAIAGSRGVARLAARHLVGAHGDPDRAAGTTCVLAPGRERAFVAPLALDLLEPEDALAEALTRFGLRCVGDLARLPRRALVSRLGPEARALLALAAGEPDATPLPPAPPAAPCEAVDLEWPIESLEPLVFVLRGLVARLCERLALRGLGCGDLDLSLALAGGGRDARRIGVATPSDDPRALLGLVRLALESHPPQAAVVGVSLGAEGRALRPDQLDWLRPAGPAPAVLARTLAELEASCGSGRVGAPHVPDDPHPDAFGLTPFMTPAAASTRASGDAPSVRDGTPVAALRRLRPPLRAEVRASGGRPAWLRSAVASGRLVGVAGPWRSDGRWWSDAARFDFESFDVQTEDGSVVRLRFDHLRRIWEVDAVYD
jgi:protein ImuB